MNRVDVRTWGRRFAARGGIIVFFVMAFEVMIMISPFAFFFYSVFNPIFNGLDAYPMTRWLTHFFLPHMVLPPTLFLRLIRVSGSVLFVLGCTTFLVCALQVYLGKVLGWGVARRGLYRFVRHPQYTALAIWGAGMAILWPRFIVLASLSIMLVLYDFLARDEEWRMIDRYGESYRAYMHDTAMFFPIPRRRRAPVHAPARPSRARRVAALLSVVAIVMGAGFACRWVTLDSLPLETRANVTLLPIMPEDAGMEASILGAIRSDGIDFLDNDRDYLGYEMPVDYIMQGMIADTGSEHHLYKQHHTVGLIADWVLHPFAHLRRSPAAHMAAMAGVDPAVARRHHCPLGIDDPEMDCDRCDYRRVVLVDVDSPSRGHRAGKALFAFDTRRTPAGFVDIDTRTGEILRAARVGSKTAWGGVPTPAI